MTSRQIRAGLVKLIKLGRRPEGYEWTAEDYQLLEEAWRRVDQESKDICLAIMRGEIDVAVSISVPR